MSEDLEAKASIELDADKFVKGSDKIQKEFQDIDKTGTKSVDSVSDSLSDMGNESTKTGDKIKQAGEKGEKAFDDLGDSADKAESDVSGLGIGVLGLGQSITGVSDAILGFNEKLVKLDRTAFGLEQTTKDLKREIEDFEIALKNGELSGIELNRALEDIAFTYRDLKIQQEEARTEAEALSGEFLSFGLSLVQTVAFGIITVNELLKSTRVQLILNKISMVGLTTATKTFVAALWTIAKHPAFLVAAAGILVWETNFLNLRGTLEEYSGVQLGIADNLMKLSDNLFPDASAAVEDTRFSLEELTEISELSGLSLEELQNTLNNTNESFVNLNTNVFDTSLSLGEDLQPSLAGISSQLKTVGTEARNAGKELDEFKKKRESISAARDFRDLSREDQDLSLIGKTGTFSRVGTNILGFRGPEFLSGGRTFRSRITSKNFTLGGQASQAIAAFQSQPTPIGPGTPAHILGRIRKRDAFMSSLAGGILAALGRRGLGRKASRAYDRAGVWPVVAIVREGIEKGFLTMGYVRELLENTSSANGAAGVISSLATQVQQLDEENEARLLQISEDSGLSVSNISNLEKTEEGILQINQAIFDTETQKGIDAFNAEQAAIQSSIDLRGITSFDQREKLISSMM